MTPAASPPPDRPAEEPLAALLPAPGEAPLDDAQVLDRFVNWASSTAFSSSASSSARSSAACARSFQKPWKTRVSPVRTCTVVPKSPSAMARAALSASSAWRAAATAGAEAPGSTLLLSTMPALGASIVVPEAVAAMLRERHGRAGPEQDADLALFLSSRARTARWTRTTTLVNNGNCGISQPKADHPCMKRFDGRSVRPAQRDG